MFYTYLTPKWFFKRNGANNLFLHVKLFCVFLKVFIYLLYPANFDKLILLLTILNKNQNYNPPIFFIRWNYINHY